MFRFPKASVNLSEFEPYVLPDAITITPTSKYVVLDIEINQEEGIGGWVEGKGWLPRLLPLRDELLNGDVRLLYLVWLRVASYLSGDVLEDDPIEPPILPNLDQLSPALKTFIELVELDVDRVAAAAQASPHHQASPDAPLENWLPALSEVERQAFLLKLVRREPHVDLQLINRLRELAGEARSMPQSALEGRRRLSEMEAIAKIIRENRQRKEQNAARKK